jgi:hypothetical protein
MQRNDKGFNEIGAVVLTVLALIAIPLAIWAASVAAAPLFGKGEAFKQKESAVNRVFAQGYFQTTAKEIKATQAKINQLAATKPRSLEQEVRYEGLRSYCAGLIGDYNAKSETYTTQQFKDASLPASFDAATDCEPTV